MADPRAVDIMLDRPRKLLYRHKDIRDAVNSSGKSIVMLLDDLFGGWPYLLLHGLRHQDTRLTLDDCSEMLDRVAQSGEPIKTVQDKLIAAIEKTGFIKIQRPESEATEDPQNPTT